jgi:antitoxin (DNA-binding transcriptional repressor) of toxin-antitoxin stability system
MTTRSVDNAKPDLSEAIDRRLDGDEAILFRLDQSVAALRPVAAPKCRAAQVDLDWLAERRMKRTPAPGKPPLDLIVTEVIRMRDEDWR